MDTAKRLIDMTLGELLDILDKRDAERRASEQPSEPTEVEGLQGIMDIFKCSKSMAYRLKASHKIDEAITQVGARKFSVNVRKAKQLMQL